MDTRQVLVTLGVLGVASVATMSILAQVIGPRPVIRDEASLLQYDPKLGTEIPLPEVDHLGSKVVASAQMVVLSWDPVPLVR